MICFLVIVMGFFFFFGNIVLCENVKLFYIIRIVLI